MRKDSVVADIAETDAGRVTVPTLRDTADPDSDGHRPPLQAEGQRGLPKTSKASAAMRERWRKIRAGEMVAPDKRPKPARGSGHPLFHLPGEERGHLFAWLRECPYNDVIQQLLRERGLPPATPTQLNEFFESEAEDHWENRLGRAAQEANALVRLAEKSTVQFSGAILAALGQEAFRQIASGQAEPGAMGKLATLFLRARSDERADQMQELKREKLRRDMAGDYEQALDRLSDQVERNPAAREAFETLKKELATKSEDATEAS